MNLTTERLVGVSTNMEFRRAEIARIEAVFPGVATPAIPATAWSTVTATHLSQGGPSFTSLIPTAAQVAQNDGPVTIEVRFRSANGAPASQSFELKLNARPVAPVVGPAAIRFVGTPSANDNGHGNITGLTATTAHQLRVSTVATWTGNDAADATFDLPASSSDGQIIYQIRTAPVSTVGTGVENSTTGTPASAETSLTVPARPAVPTAAYNAVQDSITGVTTAMEFTRDAAAPFTWTEIAATSLTRAAVSGTAFGMVAGPISIRVAPNATHRASLMQTFNVPATVSSTPAATMNLTTETLNATTAMEFSVNGGAWTRVSGNNTHSITNLIPATGSVTIAVRYASADGNPPSDTVELTLNARPAAPVAGGTSGVRFVANAGPATADGQIQGLVGNNQLRVSTAAWGAVTETATFDLPADTNDAGVTYNVRRAPVGTTPSGNLTASTSGTPASNAINVTIPARPSAPSGVVYNAANDEVRGITAAMEYSFDGEAPWTAGGSTLARTTLGANTVVYVRVRVTETTRASRTTRVTIPGSVVAPTGVTVNFFIERLAGTTTAMEFRRGGANATPWTAVTQADLIAGGPRIDGLIPATGTFDIEVRFAATGSNPASVPLVIAAVPNRPATPGTGIAFSGTTPNNHDQGSITGVTAQQEIRMSNVAWWSPTGGTAYEIPANAPTGEFVYLIRVAATATAFASGNFEITVPAIPSAPAGGAEGVRLNTGTRAIEGLSTTLHAHRFGTAAYANTAATTLEGAAIGTNDATTISVRYRGSATARPSLPIVINIPAAGGTAPTVTNVINRANEHFTAPITTAMEFSTGATAGLNPQPVTSALLASGGISHMIPATGGANVNVFFRTAATPTTAASAWSAAVVLNPRPAAPALGLAGGASGVRFVGNAAGTLFGRVITTTTPDNTMQVRITDGAPVTEWTAANADPNPGLVGATAPAITYQVRMSPTDTAFASLPVTVVVPARAAAPTGIGYDIVTDTITGVSVGQEFRATATGTWTAVTGTAITRAQMNTSAPGTDPFVANGTVYVRTAATPVARPSQEFARTNVPAAPDPSGDTPNVLLDRAEERITGLLNTMEWQNPTTGAWTVATTAQINSGLSVTPFIPATGGADVVINVRFRAIAAGANQQAQSDPTVITLNARPATPNLALNPTTERVTAGSLTNIEYRIGTAAWRAPTGVTPALGIIAETNTAVTYSIRVAPSATHFASSAQTVLVPARRAAPSASYAIATDSITGVSTSIEYSIESGAPDSWKTVAAGTEITRDMLDALVDGSAVFEGGAVAIRLVASGTDRASTARFIVVPPAPPAAPSGAGINHITERLTGVTAPVAAAGSTAAVRGMEFRRVTLTGDTNGVGGTVTASTAWTTVTAAHVTAGGAPISTLIPGSAGNWWIEVRFRAADGLAASQVERVRIAHRPTLDDKDIEFDFDSDTIVNVDDTMIWRVGTSGAFTLAGVITPAAGATRIAAGVDHLCATTLGWTSATTVRLVSVATSTAFESEPFRLAVPAAPAAPRPTYNRANGVITGVTSAMEFRTFDADGDELEDWTAVAGTAIIAAQWDAAVRVEVRLAATSGTRASRVASLAVNPAAAAASLNIDFGALSALTTTESALSAND
jgi:hypothetical protein